MPRFRFVVLLLIVAALLPTGSISAQDGGTLPDVSGYYVMHAETMVLEAIGDADDTYTLTLYGVDPFTLGLIDTPEPAIRAFSTEALVTPWELIATSVPGLPATLEAGSFQLDLTLNAPVYDDKERSIAYIAVIHAQMPDKIDFDEEIGPVALVIPVDRGLIADLDEVVMAMDIRAECPCPIWCFLVMFVPEECACCETDMD